MMTSIKLGCGAVALAIVACGPVARSDPGFWDPADDVGGKQYNFSNVGGTASFGGGPALGGGPPSYAGGPPNYGGGPPSYGGAPPNYGGGPPNYGGAPPNYGGAPPSYGGAPPGYGGDPGAAGGPPVSAGGAPPVGNSGPCNFTFTVTTVTANGRFAPRNVGALWIENSGGQFVKALEVWGGQRLSNLTAFSAVGGNSIDAVTSATISNHRQHSRPWNCSNTSGGSVDNGNYQACVSFAEDDAIPFFGPAPHLQCYPFQVGAGPASSNPPDVANFKGWTLSMQ